MGAVVATVVLGGTVVVSAAAIVVVGGGLDVVVARAADVNDAVAFAELAECSSAAVPPHDVAMMAAAIIAINLVANSPGASLTVTPEPNRLAHHVSYSHTYSASE